MHYFFLFGVGLECKQAAKLHQSYYDPVRKSLIQAGVNYCFKDTQIMTVRDTLITALRAP